MKKVDFIQGAAAFLYKKCLLKWNGKEELREKFGILYHKHNCDKKYEEFIILKWTLILKILLVGSLLSLGILVQEVTDNDLLEDNSIQRNQVGGESKEVALLAKVQGIEEEIALNIEAQSYPRGELDRLFQEMLPTLDKIILGANKSIDCIVSDLNLITEVEGYPFRMEWETDNTTIISQTGKLENALLKEEVVVQLTAKILYRDYNQDYLFSVVVYPKTLSVQEQFFQLLKETAIKQETSTRESSKYILPTMVQQTNISWSEKKKSGSGAIFACCIVAALLIGFVKDKEVERQIQEREKQLLRYYPEIVSKLTLFIGAGMNLQGAIGKLVADYDKKRTENGPIEYAYEEFWVLNNEIKMGVSETTAYMQFGRRCKLQNYKKLSTLLMQSLKKGNGNLLTQLETETKSALEERKSSAKKRGEEASTKMLGPMMLMLFIVMLIIIVPAFGSFTM